MYKSNLVCLCWDFSFEIVQADVVDAQIDSSVQIYIYTSSARQFATTSLFPLLTILIYVDVQSDPSYKYINTINWTIPNNTRQFITTSLLHSTFLLLPFFLLRMDEEELCIQLCVCVTWTELKKDFTDTSHETEKSRSE